MIGPSGLLFAAWKPRPVCCPPLAYASVANVALRGATPLTFQNVVAQPFVHVSTTGNCPVALGGAHARGGGTPGPCALGRVNSVSLTVTPMGNDGAPGDEKSVFSYVFPRFFKKNA